MQDLRPGISVMSVGEPAVALVALVGEHDLSSCRELEQALTQLLSDGQSVVIDLTELRFAESAILGTLIVVEARAGRGRFAVVAPPETPAARLLDLVDARTIFTTFPTRMAAIEWCRPGRVAPAG
jgi:anti-anti-sigma factor